MVFNGRFLFASLPTNYAASKAYRNMRNAVVHALDDGLGLDLLHVEVLAAGDVVPLVVARRWQRRVLGNNLIIGSVNHVFGS